MVKYRMERKMITIVNAHGDELERVQFFLDSLHSVHVGTLVPDGDVIICPDIPMINTIDDKSNWIIQPCVMDAKGMSNMGYKKAILKDTYQKWGAESIILPPVFKDIPHSNTFQYEKVALVHHFYDRDPRGCIQTESIGAQVIGYGGEKVEHDFNVLPYTKFLIHFKTIGYLCNAVIKAMNYNVPVIFLEKSYEYGYKDYLTKDFSCKVFETPEQAKDFIDNCTNEEYEALKKGIQSEKDKWRAKYPDIKKAFKQFINESI